MLKAMLLLKNNWKKIWNAMGTIVGRVVNFIIKALNKISFEIPKWVPGIGGKGFGINIPLVNIPKLGHGAIVTRPTLALIGESGPEAVVPLSGGRGMGGVTVIVQGNVWGTDLEKIISNALIEANRRGMAI